MPEQASDGSHKFVNLVSVFNYFYFFPEFSLSSIRVFYSKLNWNICILTIFIIFRPKEFIDCIAHIRLLSWLLLGSLTHSAVCPQNTNVTQMLCTPIPLEAGIHIADHVQVILAGFAEQSKASVLHMSSLFHVFILCQVNLYVLMLYICYSLAYVNMK